MASSPVFFPREFRRRPARFPHCANVGQVSGVSRPSSYFPRSLLSFWASPVQAQLSLRVVPAKPSPMSKGSPGTAVPDVVVSEGGPGTVVSGVVVSEGGPGTAVSGVAVSEGGPGTAISSVVVSEGGPGTGPPETPFFFLDLSGVQNSSAVHRRS